MRIRTRLSLGATAAMLGIGLWAGALPASAQAGENPSTTSLHVESWGNGNGIWETLYLRAVVYDDSEDCKRNPPELRNCLAPSGLVDFFDGSRLLRTVRLAPQSEFYSSPFFSWANIDQTFYRSGEHELRAVYRPENGSAFRASTSNTVKVTTTGLSAPLTAVVRQVLPDEVPYLRSVRSLIDGADLALEGLEELAGSPPPVAISPPDPPETAVTPPEELTDQGLGEHPDPAAAQDETNGQSSALGVSATQPSAATASRQAADPRPLAVALARTGGGEVALTAVALLIAVLGAWLVAYSRQLERS